MTNAFISPKMLFCFFKDSWTSLNKFPIVNFWKTSKPLWIKGSKIIRWLTTKIIKTSEYIWQPKTGLVTSLWSQLISKGFLIIFFSNIPFPKKFIGSTGYISSYSSKLESARWIPSSNPSDVLSWTLGPDLITKFLVTFWPNRIKRND